MADHRDHGQEQHLRYPSSLAVASLLALAGGLLVLSFTALVVSITGLAVAAPLLLLCSPVLVPAALLMALEGIGMAASGALALGAVALLSRLWSAARKAAATPPDYVEEGKRQVAELAGEKTSHVDTGQALQTK
ncbi:hypothetical protein ACQ4PT_027523 [Festuca glaucescens]